MDTLARTPAGASADPTTQQPTMPANTSSAASAPAADTDAMVSALSGMDLESLLEIGVSQLDSLVVSSTKTAQRAAQTPAIVTIITGDEMRSRGYASLAAALRAVPGFYDVDDLVTHNLGVRGINGGKGASGNVVIVMIDGMPVDYEPSTGNFLGPELLPLEMIDRVEVIRGPASALYGPNAFLGAINIITRANAALTGVRLTAQGGATRTLPMGGGSVVGGAAFGTASLALGLSYLQQDRSGLSLPVQSPALDTLVGPTITKRGGSQNDLTRPLSGLVKAEVGELGGGQLSFLGSVQRLDSVDEFNGQGAMTHGSRVQLLNQNYRLTYSREWDKNSLTAGVRYLNGQPTADDRLDIGNTNYRILRHESVRGAGASLEGHLALSSEALVIVGTDLLVERQRLLTYDQRWSQNIYDTDNTLLHRAGTTTQGTNPFGTEKTFRNVGAFGQLSWQLGDAWSTTLGTRVDVHSIYGTQWSPRAGLVFAPTSSPVNAKLLFGSSFKAPSAEQLFAQPNDDLHLEGNPKLAAQQARTLELAVGLALPDKLGEINVNGFVTEVRNRVEFVQVLYALRATNIPREVDAGGEIEARLTVTTALRVRLAAGFVQNMLRELGRTALASTDNKTAAYPTLQLHSMLDYTLPWQNIRLGLEASYVSARNAFQSNAVVLGRVYSLDPYVFTAFSASLPRQRWFGERDTTLSLRVENALNSQWVSPGFNGVDVPTPGVCVLLTLRQQL